MAWGFSLFVPTARRVPGSGECRGVASQPANQPANQPASQLASQPASQPARARLGKRVDRRAAIPMRALRSRARGDVKQSWAVRAKGFEIEPQAVPLAKSQGAQRARLGPNE